MVEQAPAARARPSRTRRAVQGVVVYRALTWLLPIPIGTGTYLWWRRRSWTAQAQATPGAVGVQRP